MKSIEARYPQGRSFATHATTQDALTPLIFFWARSVIISKIE
jgi:hypothetical protein